VSVEFKIIPAIRVEINHDESEERRSTPAIDFMRWCMKNDVLGFRGCSTGPTGLVQYFEVEDSDKIRTYMLEQGFIEA
jgi:hypothetical protein